MEKENIETQLKKGILEFCILTALSKKEMYAGEIIEKLILADLIIVEGTIYPLLSRIKSEQLVSYRWEESDSGPPRKYYSLTDKGSKKLELFQSVWSQINNSIKILSK
jgi:PadR family transcriptional regulator, regulatory protein PadR